MNRIYRTLWLGGMVVLLAGQGAFATLYNIQNITADFWAVPRSFHNGDIWKDQGGVMPVLTTNDEFNVSSKPVDLTINLYEAAVSVNFIKLGRYATDADVATLNVTTNLSTLGIFQIAAAGGNAALNVSGTTVSSGGQTTIGHTNYSGALTIDNAGIFESLGTFTMLTNSTVTVNDGILKMLAGSGSRISMVGGATLNLNGDSELWLGGDQTGAESAFNSYIDSGWILANGNTGINQFNLVFDGTKTIVTVPEAANNPPAFTTDPMGKTSATEDVAYTGQTLAGSATDPDAVATLTYSKVSGPTWLSIAANGTLSGTPANSDVGANSWTVQVSDGLGGTDTATLNIVVVLDYSASAYDSFADDYGIRGKPKSGPQEDYDGDGLRNIYEFGLGGNPTNASDSGVLPVYGINSNVLRYVHVRLVDSALTYYLETDDNLTVEPGWANAGWSVVGVGPTVDSFETVTNEVDASGDVGFVRLVVAEAAVKPNVLIYLADDLGYGSINTYGAPTNLVQTPHLDQLAADGVQFNYAYTTASVCTPTRYAMLTGEYAWRGRLKTGVIDDQDYTLIDPNRISMARWMQQQGYVTAHVGKWHLGYKGEGPVVNLLGDLSPGAIGNGFDYHFALPANLGDTDNIYIENNGIWGLNSATITPFGCNWYAAHGGNIKPYTGYDSPQIVTNTAAPSATYDHLDDVMTFTTDKAVEWLQNQSTNTPFFLYYAAVAVHNPIEPAPELRGLSAAGLYGDFINEVDHTFGRLVACLEAKGVLDNTIIIFGSDNGGDQYGDAVTPVGVMPQYIAEAAGLSINGQTRGDKGTIYEGGSRTPLIISHPNGGIPKGAISTAKVSTVDYYATLVDYIAGTNALQNLDAPDSVSFKEELLNPGTSSFERAPFVLSDSSGWKAVHFDHNGNRWKYIEAQTGEKPVAARLYDMDADPLETYNYAPSMPEMAETGRLTLEAIVDGDDIIEWDNAGGGYRHCPAYSPRSGQYHLEMKAITGVTGKPYCYVTKDMPATEGEEWTASSYAWLTEAPGGGQASALVKLKYKDALGGNVSIDESVQLTSTGSDYVKLEVSAIAPAGTVTAQINVTVNLNGEAGTVGAYFDDASLERDGVVVWQSGFETQAVE